MMKNNLNKFDFDQEVKNCKTLDDVTGNGGLIQKMIRNVIESMLQNEMTEFLGHEKNESFGEPGNYRNGTSTKTLKTGFGKVKIECTT